MYPIQNVILWKDLFEKLGSIRAVVRYVSNDKYSKNASSKIISENLKEYFKIENKDYIKWYNNFAIFKLRKIVGGCENCGASFVPNNYIQRFCSRKCQNNNLRKVNKKKIKIYNEQYFSNKKKELLKYYSNSKTISSEIIKVFLFLEQERKINETTRGRYFDLIISIEKKLKWVFSQDNILKILSSAYFTDLSFRTKSMYSRVLFKYLKWKKLEDDFAVIFKNPISKYDFLESFVNKSCIVAKNTNILQKVLIESINNFYQKLIIPKENCGGLTRFLVKYGVSTVGKSLNRRKYIGITLNSKGLKLLNNIDSNRKLNRMKLRKQQNLTKSNICKYISCNPCVQELERVVIAYNNQVTLESDRIDFLRSKKILKNIEMLLFKINIFRKSQVKIGLAIYLTSDYTREFISKVIVICSPISIRDLEKVIIKRFPQKWKWLNRYKKDQIIRHYSKYNFMKLL